MVRGIDVRDRQLFRGIDSSTISGRDVYHLLEASGRRPDTLEDVQSAESELLREFGFAGLSFHSVDRRYGVFNATLREISPLSQVNPVLALRRQMLPRITDTSAAAQYLFLFDAYRNLARRLELTDPELISKVREVVSALEMRPFYHNQRNGLRIILSLIDSFREPYATVGKRLLEGLTFTAEGEPEKRTLVQLAKITTHGFWGNMWNEVRALADLSGPAFAGAPALTVSDEALASYMVYRPDPLSRWQSMSEPEKVAERVIHNGALVYVRERYRRSGLMQGRRPGMRAGRRNAVSMALVTARAGSLMRV